MNRDRQPILITDAPRSQDDQRHSREIRYVLMMSVRVVSLILAAVLVSVHAPLPWVWGPLCLIGMVLVPWLAVVLANDRPPRDEHRLRRFRRRPPGQGPAIPAHGEPPAIDADA